MYSSFSQRQTFPVGPLLVMESGLLVQIIIIGNPAAYVSKVKYINNIDVKDVIDIIISIKNKNNLLSKQLSIFLNLILV